MLIFPLDIYQIGIVENLGAEAEKEKNNWECILSIIKALFLVKLKFSCTGLKNLFHGYALRNSKNESTSVHFFALVPVSGYDLF